jgi:hypothetical protein
MLMVVIQCTCNMAVAGVWFTLNMYNFDTFMLVHLWHVILWPWQIYGCVWSGVGWEREDLFSVILNPPTCDDRWLDFQQVWISIKVRISHHQLCMHLFSRPPLILFVKLSNSSISIVTKTNLSTYISGPIFLLLTLVDLCLQHFIPK